MAKGKKYVDSAKLIDRAAQYDVTYVPIPYTRTANDGHPTVSGHKYIGRQILKAVNY